jgi:hypothetical protein
MELSRYSISLNFALMSYPTIHHPPSLPFSLSRFRPPPQTMSSRNRSGDNHGEVGELEDRRDNVLHNILLSPYAEVSRYNPEEVIDWLDV